MTEPRLQPPPPETPAVRAAIERLLAMEMAACLAAVEPLWLNGQFVGVQAIIGVPMEAAGTRFDRGQLIQLAVPKSTMTTTNEQDKA